PSGPPRRGGPEGTMLDTTCPRAAVSLAALAFPCPGLSCFGPFGAKVGHQGQNVLTDRFFVTKELSTSAHKGPSNLNVATVCPEGARTP
ncbi:MAG: hypothetical protein KDA60_13295, partial [Planctomycetales bacterium]|nr:hypothetical protein [Planctomycetales bacterium]